jgi:hypothetical protein
MTQGTDSTGGPAQPGSLDPYVSLGISPDASFDAVQAAKQARLAEVGEDPISRARIEAAYDAVLMDRLKERQQGKVSTAALNASEREAAKPAAKPTAGKPVLPSMPSLPALPRPALNLSASALPRVALAEGRERWLPVASGAVLLVILLLSPAANAELVLAFATVLTVVNLQRRLGRLLPAVGWSVLLLSAGLLLGGLLVSAIDPSLPLGLPLAPLQVQSLPALVLLVLGALLIA